jgi:predicted MFS family arabinose efflux permease
LVAVVGAANVLLLDAATFLLSAVFVALAVPSRTDAENKRSTPGFNGRGHQVFADSRLMQSPARQYLSELRDGFRFVRTSGLLMSLIVITTVASMLEKPLMSVVAPVYASDIYGSAASFGAMLGAFGAGALVGTLAFSVVGHRLPRRLTFLTCMLLAPVVMFGSLAATPPLVYGAIRSACC